MIEGVSVPSSRTGLKAKGLRGAGSLECATGEGETESFFVLRFGVFFSSSFAGRDTADACTYVDQGVTETVRGEAEKLRGTKSLMNSKNKTRREKRNILREGIDMRYITLALYSGNIAVMGNVIFNGSEGQILLHSTEEAFHFTKSNFHCFG